MSSHQTEGDEYEQVPTKKNAGKSQSAIGDEKDPDYVAPHF